MAKRKSVRKRRPSQKQSRKGLGWWAYALIAGAIIIVSGGIVFSNQTEAPPAIGAVSLDKSKGAEDAPVVVVEFGDFQ